MPRGNQTDNLGRYTKAKPGGKDSLCKGTYVL